MTTVRFLLAALTALAVWTLGGPAEAQPRFLPGACVGDYSGVPNRVECGTVVVEETRDRPGRKVVLPVVVVRARGGAAARPPVFYLHGGPGGDAVESLARRLRSPAARDLFAVDQDWIVFDQRGSGLATPLLDCGALSLTDAGLASDADAAALADCGRRQTAAGVDLGRFNAAEVARDVQDVRAALKIDRFDLFGVSYGTRIALAVLQHAPDGVRAVVLDSVWPQEGVWTDPRMVSKTVRQLMAMCAADTACGARHSGLEGKVDAMARRWLTTPVTFEGRAYTADDLSTFLMDAAYSGGGARALPGDLDRFAAGDLSALRDYVADRSGYVEGQHMTHLCKEELPFESAAAARTAGRGDPLAQAVGATMARLFAACRGFAVGPIDPAEGRPMSSDVPTLFLAAEIDPGCPPELAAAAAKRFSRSQSVLVPNVTHGVFAASACSRRMIRSFFADPSRPVDRACLTTEHARFVFDG